MRISQKEMGWCDAGPFIQALSWIRKDVPSELLEVDVFDVSLRINCELGAQTCFKCFSSEEYENSLYFIGFRLPKEWHLPLLSLGRLYLEIILNCKFPLILRQPISGLSSDQGLHKPMRYTQAVKKY